MAAQLVKNLPAMRETRVQFPGWEDPLEKGTATHSSVLAWVPKSWTRLRDFHFSKQSVYFFSAAKREVNPPRKEYLNILSISPVKSSVPALREI